MTAVESASPEGSALSDEAHGLRHLLDVRDLDFSYASLQVLFRVDLKVRQGEVLALLGTNGAGKSTLLRAITGLAPSSGGSVTFNGVDITSTSAESRVRSGIVQVPGGKAVFPQLSVAENLRLGGFLLRKKPRLLKERQDNVLELFPNIRDRLNQPAGSLSGGQRQMLALAKGLLLEPKLLCIDELSLGLAPVVVQELLQVVEHLKATGVALLIVEQSVKIALSMSDRAVFMEKGRVRFEGAAGDLAERDDLVRAVFLGGSNA